MLRVLPVHPDHASTTAAALAKLFVQFEREGRCSGAAITPVAGGHALAIAWDGPELSGCSHDKINHAAAMLGAGASPLDLPPVAVETADGWTRTDRAGLRRLIAEGRIAADSRILDQAGVAVALRDSWAGALLPTA